MTKFATSPFWNGMKTRLGLLLMSGARLAAAEPSSLWSVPNGVVARISVEAELSLHRAFEPVSIAPDLVIATTAHTAVTLHYSRTSHAQLGAGNGICLVGVRETLEAAAPRCEESETGLGIGGLVDLGPTTLRGGIVSRGPGALAAELGAVGFLRSPHTFAIAAPTLLVAGSGRAHGNRERLQFALYGGVRLGRLEVHLRSGVEAALATFEDTLAIPIGAGLSFQVGRVRVGVDATIDRAFGALNGMRERSASMFVETKFGAS